MNYLDILRAQLLIDEGDRSKPYRDQFGNITIGIGRNLSGVGISADEKALMFSNDCDAAEKAARIIFSSFDALSDNRKAALVNLAFNLGEAKLSTFTVLISLINANKFPEAADDLKNTAWHQQVGNRALRIESNIRQG